VRRPPRRAGGAAYRFWFLSLAGAERTTARTDLRVGSEVGGAGIDSAGSSRLAWRPNASNMVLRCALTSRPNPIAVRWCGLAMIVRAGSGISISQRTAAPGSPGTNRRTVPGPGKSGWQTRRCSRSSTSFAVIRFELCPLPATWGFLLIACGKPSRSRRRAGAAFRRAVRAMSPFWTSGFKLRRPSGVAAFGWPPPTRALVSPTLDAFTDFW
jgi:hypothetical protein